MTTHTKKSWERYKDYIIVTVPFDVVEILRVEYRDKDGYTRLATTDLQTSNGSVVVREEPTVGNFIQNTVIPQVREETEKAFGGCKKCYGKGYSTVLDWNKGADDFGGEGFELQNDVIRPCSCDRGKQIKEIIQKLSNNDKN